MLLSSENLSLAQIPDLFEPVPADIVLQCMTNVHWGRIRFSDARLIAALHYYADLSEEARITHLRCAVWLLSFQPV